MASTKVRGITIELNADTSGITKGLKAVNSEIGATQKQLKDVDRLLKLDPTNTQLLEQKQRLLKDAVGETTTKLDTLKKAQEEVGRTLKETGEGQEQYDALTREIISCENELKKAEKAADSFNISLEKVSAAGKNIQQFGDKISGVGQKMLPVTAAVAGMGTAAVKFASDYEENINKVDVAFKGNAAEVKSWAKTATEQFGLSENAALQATSLFGDMGTAMGLTTDDAAGMATSLAGLAGDLSSFKNVSIEQAMTALNGVFTGETESLKQLGVVMTQTNLEEFAGRLGLVYNEMSQAEKVSLRYQYVMEQTSNAQGDYSRTSDGLANSVRTMQASIDNLAVTFGQELLPIITPIINALTDVIKRFGDLDDKTKKIIVTVGLTVAAIAPLLIVFGQVVSAVGAIMQVLPLLSGAFTALGNVVAFVAANPIVILMAAIVALVALIATKGDEIQRVLRNVDNFMQNVFARDFTQVFGPVLGEYINAFVANIRNMWNAVQQILNGLIDFIRGVFTGDWERAWRGVQQIFEGIFDGLVAIAKAPLNGIIGLLNMAINGINDLIEGFNNMGFEMPDWLGGGSWSPNIPTIGHIPYLAKGGILSQGSAIVGEAGAELLTMAGGRAIVQPLTNNTINNAGATNNFYIQSSDPEQVAEEVATILNNQVQRQQYSWA